MITFGPAAFAAAFAAGFLSFLSPCVLPLVPGHLSLVSGVGFDEIGARPRRVVTSIQAFVAGFGSMFVLLGAGAAWFGDVLLTNRRTLEVVAGVFIVLNGLVYAGVPLPLTLLREKRFHLKRREGLVTPASIGVASASAGLRASARRLPRSSHSLRARAVPHRARSCWASTPSGSASRPCCSASGSRGRPGSSRPCAAASGWSA